MSIRASAPGKVLVCGGYLVVESPNVGLSLGVTARFTTAITAVGDGAPGTVGIAVASPQFSAAFRFAATLADGRVSVQQTEGRSSPFLFNAVLVVMAYVAAHGGEALFAAGAEVSAVLKGGNDFYSQRNYLAARGQPVSAATLRTVPEYAPLEGEVSKTGLGSSAALTTSFVACLLRWAEQHGLPAVSDEARHRLAQAAHSVAQGKIGSGFDVHTACFGTNVYARFPPARVDKLMPHGSEQPTSYTVADVAAVVDAAAEWVPQVKRAPQLEGLPTGMHMLLADIHQGGSATPGLVSKVMAWRKAVAGDEGNLWDQLAAANEAYLATLTALCGLQGSDEYAAAVAAFAALPAADWTAATEAQRLLCEFHDRANTTRRLLRSAGEAAGVEIEPPVLTPLLDATAALPGVVAVGCPGAGGYDAVFALTLGGTEQCAAVEAAWEAFSGLEVCPLLVREESRGVVFQE